MKKGFVTAVLAISALIFVNAGVKPGDKAV
jgi:hypothetical protein